MNCLLEFELVGQNQIGVVEESPVDRHDTLADIEASFVAHDGIEDCSQSDLKPIARATMVMYPRRTSQLS